MNPVSRSFEAIGTHWHIDINAPSADEHVGLFGKIIDTINEFDKNYSRFRDDSLVSQIAKKAGMYTLPPDAKVMFDLYEKLYKLTDGLFTPLIGDVMVSAGYDATYSFKAGKLRQPLSWNDVLTYQFPTLTISRPVVLDLGGIGKGYLIDIVGDLIHNAGVENFTVDAGGDILHHDSRGGVIRVGLEHPENQKQVIGVVELGNQSICGSSGNRRVWGNFHHIINPQTLSSPRNILASWVIAPSAIIADALATCLFLVPPEKLANDFSFEYLILYPDSHIERSEGFMAELFTT